MASRLDLLLEAERRGMTIAPRDAELLGEARKRGIVPPRAGAAAPGAGMAAPSPGPGAAVAPTQAPEGLPPVMTRRRIPSLVDIPVPGQEGIEVEEIDPLATAARDIGVTLGEAPFGRQAGAAFGIESAQPLRQMLERGGFETRTIEQEGPLKGQLVFRRAGTQEPWTTARDPRGLTQRAAGAAALGMAPTVGLGIAGAAVAPFALPAQIGMGAAAGGAGEFVRQRIGRGLGLQHTPPGQPVEPGQISVPEQEALGREAALGAAGPMIGRVIGGTLRRIFGAGGLPAFDTASYRQALMDIERELTQALGPEEARRAMEMMTAAAPAAAMREGGTLEAQIQRLQRTPQGAPLAEQAAAQERYIQDVANRLLGGEAAAQRPTTGVGQMVEAQIPQPLTPSAPPLTALARTQLEQAAAQGEEALRRTGLRGIEELTAGRAAPVPGRALGEAVERAAPAPSEVIPGRVVDPESAQVGQIVKAGLERAEQIARGPASQAIEGVVQRFGAEQVQPANVASVAEQYRQRLAGRNFPSVAPESQRLVDDFFSRAVDEQGNLRPQSLAQLREDSSNLKEAVRRTYTGQYSGEVRMLNDFVRAVDEDILDLLRQRGGPQAVDQYSQGLREYRQVMDLFERTQGLPGMGALRRGGAEVVGDARAAGLIFGNADTSRAYSEAISNLPPMQQAQVADTVRATLRWELMRRAVPGTGRDVSPESLANAIRDNAEVLRPWFNPQELADIQARAGDIANVRKVMGVGRNQDAGEWFEKSFWNANPDAAQTIMERVRRQLPRGAGPDSAEATIETLRSLTRQKVYNEYTKIGADGTRQFSAEKFLGDMMDNPSRQQYYQNVFGPQWGARAREIADIYAGQAQKLNSAITAARAKISTDAAQKDADDKIAQSFRAMSREARQLFRAPEGFNKTRWMEDRWNDMDVDNIRAIVSAAGPDSELVKAMRDRTLNIIFKNITERRYGMMKGAVTDRPMTAINEENLLKIANDPNRVEWLSALFGSRQEVAKRLTDLTTVLALLKPDQAKVILTQATDPALISIEQLRRIRNVVFGPLNPKSRITTRLLEWGGDRLRQRAVDALMSPEAFLALQEASKPTRAGMVGEALGGQAIIRYLLPENTAGTIDRVQQKVMERAQ